MQTEAPSAPMTPRISQSGNLVLVIFASIAMACALGILSRPAGLLASFWPANALLLALFLRLPGAARPLGWLAGFGAMVVTDLVFGSSIAKALCLNAMNILSVAVAWLTLRGREEDIIRLRTPASVLWLLLAALLGSLAAGLVAMFAYPAFFNSLPINGLIFWGGSEIINYVSLLPLLLTAPPPLLMLQRLRRGIRMRRTDLLPATALLASALVSFAVRDPALAAFPILALLWCAIQYPIFPVALLTFLVSTFAMIAVGLTQNMGDVTTIEVDLRHLSMRLASTALAVAPILLAIVMRSRRELMAELSRLAHHDPLTGLLNRNAFRTKAEAAMQAARAPAAILMLDLDRFKSINDTYGHYAGDEVLRGTAKRLTSNLRPEDLVGRVGGEEFAIYLVDCDTDGAAIVAERLRAALADQPITLEAGGFVPISGSFGICHLPDPQNSSLDQSVARADAALYNAKHLGRNRFAVAP